jgi:pimeloyl-ACP methyl ester carboxylesterase
MADHSNSKITVNGCTIRLMRGGSGPPLLVLHGASGAGPWSAMLDSLAERFDVIVPEHPGFGESDTPDWLDTVHDLAYFYLDVLDHLRLERVHLVGISLGGWIAAELAVRDPGRLISLTLAGSAGLHVPGLQQVDPFLRSDEQRIRDFFHDQKRADAAVAEALKPELEDVMMKNRITVARLSWQPRGHDPHLAKWLHRIDVPTLLVWGEHDRLFPKDYAYAFQRLIPGATTMIVPDCGHVPHLEQPAVFVAAVRDFIGNAKVAA